MDAKSENWDDLRVFLAVARAGTLSGAARTLRVNHSTVFRRIGAFETELGVRLFDGSREAIFSRPPAKSCAMEPSASRRRSQA